MKKFFRKIVLVLASIMMTMSMITTTPIMAASERTLSSATNTGFDGDKIVSYARQWIGKIPYVWGGRDMNNPSNGLDCSGFVDFVFIKLGYTDLQADLWGSTYKITDVGMTGTAWWDNLMKQNNVTYSEGTVQTVSTGNAQPGDIVMYYDESGTPYHMGIYSGNGKLVHECENLTTGAVNNVTESALDTCVEKHNVDIKSVRIYRVVNSDPDFASLKSTKTGTGKIDVNLSVYKTDDESGKPLSDVTFEFHRVTNGNDEVLGIQKTNANGIASIQSTITQDFEETSSSYKYITDWKNVSDSVKKVWLDNGFLDGTTPELKASIQEKADKEAQDKVDADIEEFETQTITYYAVETNTKTKYWLNPENTKVSTTQNNSDDIRWDMSNTRTKVTLELSKVDADTQNNQAQGDATLQGAQYALYAREDILDPADNSVIYQKDEKILEVTTDESGKAEVQNLYLGKYYWKEISAPEGYKLDEQAHSFEVSYTSQNIAVEKHAETIEEEVITGDFEITKITTNGQQSEITQPEESAVFGVVLKKYVDQYGSVEEALNHTNEMTEKEYEIMTTDKDGHASSHELAYGTYVIKQLENGAEEVDILEETFEFKVSEVDQSTVYYVINNKPTEYEVMIEKQDLDTGKTVTLSSAKFQIKDSEGNTVTQTVGGKIYDTFVTNSDGQIGVLSQLSRALIGREWQSSDDEKGTVLTPLTLEAGTYTIEEIETPDGFLSLEEPVTFTIKKSSISETTESGIPMIKVVVKNDQPSGKLEIQKQIEDFDADTSLVNRSDLSGYQFTLSAKEDIISPIDGSILYQKGDAFGTYTTDKDGNIIVENIPMGSYMLKETSTVDGCILNDEEIDVTFTQKDTVTQEYVVHKDIENKTTKIQLSKKAVTGDDELEGAHLVIKDQDGNIIDEWDSGQKPHIIEGLTASQQYTLTETICPDGYVKATTISFTVSDTGEVQNVTMIDKTVSMSKTDVGGKEVEGAVIQVIDQDGNIIDEWTSTNKEHLIKNLEEGKTYTLHEEVAAEGYVKASDIEFTVSKEKTDDHITMIDKIVDMSKLDVAGEELPGASIQILDEELNIVDEWISTEEPHRINGLEEGKTYTLHEEVAPDGYVIATDIEFTVTFEKENQHLEMTDKQVFVSKIDQMDHFVEGAKLQILDQNGTVIDEWDSLEEYAVSNLKFGETYALHEVSAPENYVKAENIEFTVIDDQTNQEIKMIDIKTDDVSITKYDATNNKELEGAKLKVTDKDGNIIDEWTSTKEEHIIKGLIVGEQYQLIEITAPDGYQKAETITFTVDDNGEVVQKVKMYDQPNHTPDTGDNSGFPLYLTLACVSGVVIAIIIIKRRKQH